MTTENGDNLFSHAVVKQRKNTFLGPTIGAVFSIFWASLILTITLWIVGAFSTDAELYKSASSRLSTLIWPSTVLAIGVPAVVAIWFGGAATLSSLRELRTHLTKLDMYAAQFSDLEESAGRVNLDIEKAKKEIGIAANSMSSGLDDFKKLNDDFKKNLMRLEDLEKIENVEHKDEELSIEDKFYKAFYRANDIFYQVLQHRNERPGQGKRQLVVGQGGLNKDQLVQSLYEEDWLEDPIYDLLLRIFVMEKSTRWKGRANLKRESVEQLYSSIMEINPDNWNVS